MFDLNKKNKLLNEFDVAYILDVPWCRRFGNLCHQLSHSVVRHLAVHISSMALSIQTIRQKIWHCEYFENMAVTGTAECSMKTQQITPQTAI